MFGRKVQGTAHYAKKGAIKLQPRPASTDEEPFHTQNTTQESVTSGEHLSEQNTLTDQQAALISSFVYVFKRWILKQAKKRPVMFTFCLLIILHLLG